MKNQIQFAAALALFTLVSSCASLDETMATAPEPMPAYDIDYPPALNELNFQSDGKRLNGLMYVADGPGPHPTVLLLHGFPGNEKNLDLAQALRADGFNVLFFHYRGAWGSEGTFSFTHVIEDVGAATDFLRANAETYRTDPDKLILIGHSMGGFAALAAGAKDETIACTAGLAPANFGAVANVLAADPDRKAGFIAYGDSLQMLAGTDGATLVSELIDNSEAFDALAYAPSFASRPAGRHRQAADRNLQIRAGCRDHRRSAFRRSLLLMVTRGPDRHGSGLGRRLPLVRAVLVGVAAPEAFDAAQEAFAFRVAIRAGAVAEFAQQLFLAGGHVARGFHEYFHEQVAGMA